MEASEWGRPVPGRRGASTTKAAPHAGERGAGERPQTSGGEFDPTKRYARTAGGSHQAHRTSAPQRAHQGVGQEWHEGDFAVLAEPPAPSTEGQALAGEARFDPRWLVCPYMVITAL